MNEMPYKFITVLSFAGWIVLSFLFWKNNQRNTNQKVVYIDSGILMQNYEEMKDANKEFEKKLGFWKQGVDSLIAQGEKELKVFEKLKFRLSTKEKAVHMEKIKAIEKLIDRQKGEVQKKAGTESTRITTELFKKINDFVYRYGKEHHYQFIMGANTTGNILYAEEPFNITNDVLEKLNQQYKNSKR